MTTKYHLWVVQYAPNKSKMAVGRHLEKSKNCNVLQIVPLLLMKFGTVRHIGPPDLNSQ